MKLVQELKATHTSYLNGIAYNIGDIINILDTDWNHKFQADVFIQCGIAAASFELHYSDDSVVLSSTLTPTEVRDEIGLAYDSTMVGEPAAQALEKKIEKALLKADNANTFTAKQSFDDVDIGGNLDVGGDINVNKLELTSDGSASTPALYFGYDPDTGMYRPGNDSIGFTTGGTERVNFSNTLTTINTDLSVKSNGGVERMSITDASTNINNGLEVSGTSISTVGKFQSGTNTVKIQGSNGHGIQMDGGTGGFSPTSPTGTTSIADLGTSALPWRHGKLSGTLNTGGINGNDESGYMNIRGASSASYMRFHGSTHGSANQIHTSASLFRALSNVQVDGNLTVGQIAIEGSNEVNNDSGNIYMQYSNGKGVRIGNAGTPSELTVYGDIKTVGSAQFDGHLTVDGVTTKTILKPKDGSKGWSSSTVTGALEITLPTLDNSTMLKFDLDIFDYANNESFKLCIAVYTNSLYSAPTAQIISSNDRNFTVRFGKSGTNSIIYVGELSSTWGYPQVNINNVLLGFAGASDVKWMDAWGIDFEASAFQGIVKSITPQVCGAGGIKLSGNKSITDLPSTYPVGLSYHEISLGSDAGYPSLAGWVVTSCLSSNRIQQTYHDRYTGDTYKRWSSASNVWSTTSASGWKLEGGTSGGGGGTPTWTDITLPTNTEFKSGYVNTRYSKVGTEVMIEGIFKYSVGYFLGSGASLSLFTLPSGSRPSGSVRFDCCVTYDGSYQTITGVWGEITSAGVITITNSNATAISSQYLCAINFRFHTS